MYFSTYPPPTLVHVSHRFTDALKPAAQKFLTVVSAAPPFQPLRHQRNVFNQTEVTSGQVRAVLRMFLPGLLGCMGSVTDVSLPGRFLRTASRSFNITSQDDAEFTFSPRS
jgi:hypothetical protein